MPTILFVAHGAAGKDLSCEILSEITGLPNAGTTSVQLAKVMSGILGKPEEVVYAERRQNRELWRETGDRIRRDDPTLLVKMALEHGPITGGCRGLPEIRAVREQRTVDLIVWIERSVPPDPTLEFGPEWADIIIDNNGTIEQLREKLTALAKFAGLFKQEK